MTGAPANERLFVSTTEAAEMLSTSALQIRHWISEGRLVGERAGRSWKVSTASLYKLAGIELPGHEASTKRERETEAKLREARRLYAELGRVLADLEA